ncbi:Uncharacterised protein [Porphyromonas cangingivalis]|nr:Uncharacterised protein [Porphyromonas cangingivalis]
MKRTVRNTLLKGGALVRADALKLYCHYLLRLHSSKFFLNTRD